MEIVLNREKKVPVQSRIRARICWTSSNSMKSRLQYQQIFVYWDNSSRHRNFFDVNNKTKWQARIPMLWRIMKQRIWIKQISQHLKPYTSS